MMSLETLAAQLRANLVDAQNSENEYKWQRAELYLAARANFPTNGSGNKAFGQWLKNEIHGTGTGVVDSATVVTKLILCATHLTREQFLSLGYTKAAEFMVVTTINKQPDLWQALLTYVLEENRGYKFIREAMKEVKAGTWGTPPEVEGTTPLLPSAAPREGAYFSEDPFTRELQRELVVSNVGKACEFLGMEPSAISPETLRAARRSASMLHHPDRGGSDFAMDCVLQASNLIAALLGLQETMNDINELVGN